MRRTAYPASRSQQQPAARKLALGLLTGVALFAGMAVHQARADAHAATPPTALTQQQAAQLTRASALSLKLPRLAASYRHAQGSDKSTSLQALLAAAQERETQLQSLLDQHPGEVLKLAVPAALRAGMPASVQSHVESRVELSGELEATYEDYADGSARLRHFLKLPNGRLELHFASNPTHLPSGVTVSAKGLRIGNALVLESGSTDIAYLTSSTTSTVSTSSTSTAGLTDTLGDQHTLVVLVNFQNDAANKPWTTTDAYSTVFTTTSDFMRENSYGQTWLSGDVSGWHTIAMDNTSCDTTKIASLANAAAAGAGYDLSAYRRFVYIFPTNTSCGWSGSSTVGGNPSQSWINGKLALSVIGHELGHAFGIQHSHSLECGSTTLGSSCTGFDYGDHFDIMGNYTAGTFNSMQKGLLGWFGGNVQPIATVTSGGSYTLDPYETVSGGTKALRIPRGTDPSTGAQQYFYLEFRQPVGFDSVLAANTSLPHGVLFHIGTDNDLQSSYQIDMTPASQSYGWDDWEDSPLPVGATYTDPSSGASITTTSASSTGATVNISFGGATCVHANPTLAFSPSTGPWVSPGTPVSYTVSVTNTDNSSCAASSFNLAASVPSGWSAGFDSASVNLQPGQTGSVQLTVTSPLSSTDGFYNAALVAANALVSTSKSSGNVTYVVSVPATNQPPVAVDDSASTATNTAVTINVLSNDYDPEGSPLSVVSTGSAANGKVAINADGSVTYTPSRRFSGTDAFTYQISDGSSTASATVTVTVGSSTTTSSGKGGGRTK